MSNYTFDKQFHIETLWYEDKIHPSRAVSFYVTGVELDNIREWCKTTLVGAHHIINISADYDMIDRIGIYKILMSVDSVDDIFTLKLTWG